MDAAEFEPVKLTSEFHDAIQLIEESGSDPVFITGSAGTGKSTLLKLFRDSSDKRSVCLAPTGVAALHVEGQTIHSFFGFPPRLLQPGDFKIWKNKRIIRKLDIIIIDEISMVRADLMDAIDHYLRSVRKSGEPFGGVKMVLFGDLYQLPPIVRGVAESNYFTAAYESPYFFSATVFDRDCRVRVYELTEVFRQRDEDLVRLLNRIRTDTMEYDDLERINSRLDPDFQSPDWCITLAARNAVVNAINQSRLVRLEGDTMLYEAKIKGKFPPNAFPADSVLSLRTGAQVIFLRNDPDLRFVNGTLGKVTEVHKDYILVQIRREDGSERVIEVEPFKWDLVEYDFDSSANMLKTRTAGEFVQYPLKLAWALTIHKAQGKTFDDVFIDLSGGGAFETGQAYVALSRCKTMDGIVLKRPLKPSDIKIDPRIAEFLGYAV
jgi:ATP-dependent DNA helicase PIF1